MLRVDDVKNDLREGFLRKTTRFDTDGRSHSHAAYDTIPSKRRNRSRSPQSGSELGRRGEGELEFDVLEPSAEVDV